jgi:hypothetical protein
VPRRPRAPPSTRRPPPEPCSRCHAGDARRVVGGEGPFCDSCADELISAATGWPRLERPPPAETYRGPNGVEHRMVYSVLRTPGGIEVLAEEDGWAVEDGYRLALVGAHDANVGSMFAQLRRMLREVIGRHYLERSTHRDGWIMRGMEIEGRLVWRDDRPGYDVVVDGRRLSWEEFGAALEPFEGWTFRLSMRDIDTAQ